MSITVIDPLEATPVERNSVHLETGWLRSRAGAIAARLRVLCVSAAVWLLYVPHYSVLWLLGPRWGMLWVRFAARCHWLLTFVGAQRATRRRMMELAPYFRCSESVSQILLKHLEMKHECFARVRVYNLHGRTSPQHDFRWEVSEESRSRLPVAEGRDRGLVVVGFHFGYFQLSVTALSQVLPNLKSVQVRFLHGQCVEQTASPIAKLVLRRGMEADQRTGQHNFFYVDAHTNMMPILRLLRGGGCIGVAADGMIAEEFVETPFLDGIIRIPSGWARLAALTRSEISIVSDRGLDLRRREITFDDHVQCVDRSDDAIRAAVQEVVRILEGLICNEPWEWHPWHRLHRVMGDDGIPRYFLRQFRANTDEQPLNIDAEAKDDRAAATCGDALSAKARSRPRVAIVSNSLTPYRIHLHNRIVEEVPDVELWSLATHGNAYDRWTGVDVPDSVRPVNFGHGEPTNEQVLLRYAAREWLKAGRIIRWLREHEISAVFCQGCGDIGRLRLLRWCRRNNIPCFLTGDFNIRSDRLAPVKRWAKRQVYGRAVAWSSGILPCGSYGKALLERYGGTAKPAYDFPFVPDISLFLRPSVGMVELVRERFNLSERRRRLVFSARMMPVKRPDLALAAFQLIADERPDWDLVMLGDGVLRNELEASVPTHLRERVKWLGFVHDPAEVAGLYAACDVLVLPSDHEPWGVVVVEAAAAGLAIVASDVVGATPELVRHGRNGKLFPRGDQFQLVQALLDITQPEAIDAAKQQSRRVLHEWLAVADPVTGFKAALKACGAVGGRQSDASRIENSDPLLARCH